MKNLSLTDPSAAELLQHAKASGAVTLSEPLKAEIITGLGPPPVIVVPPGDLSGYTKVLRLQLDPWTVGPAPNRHLYTATAGHFMPHDCVIVAITTPATLTGDAFGSIGWSDVGGDPVQQRNVVLSSVEGDFTTGLPGTGAITPGADNGSTHFSAGPNSAGYPALTIPNHTYYLNIRNVHPDEWTPTGHFDIDIEFRNPK